MTDEEFELKLLEIRSRVLSKAITPEEENNYTESLFESIRHINDHNQEFWYARELQVALEYTEWRNFKKVIDKAIITCKNSENDVSDHFVGINKTIAMPKKILKNFIFPDMLVI